jgi:cytochrome b
MSPGAGLEISDLVIRSGSDAHSSPEMVRVWDLPTRLFHWLLVLAVTAALLTGFLAPEWWLGLHLTAGYAIVLLLVFRVVWGFFGTEYARLSNMASATRGFWNYVRGLAMLRPPHYFGHNPAGVLMIFGFLIVFIFLVVTGLMIEGGEEKQGVLAGVTSYALGHGAKELHEALALLVLFMIGFHLAGVIVESWLQRVNLVRGMIDGQMPLPAGYDIPTPRRARPLAAASVLSVLAIATGGALYALSKLPPLGIPPMAENATYRTECGACHWAFHPSLLPKSSWEQLVAQLDQHFGEDASLPADKKDEIGRYLAIYSADSWDTEAANRFRLVSATDPMRITKTSYWVAKHRQIDPKIFQSPAVKSSSNCIACHKDAGTGRFDDQRIEMPPASSP